MLVLCMLLPSTSHAQTWARGQQLLIWPRVDSLKQSDTVRIQALARTSAGVPVLAPGILWSVSSTGATIRSVNSNTITMTGMASLGTVKLLAIWSTRSGVFKDSINIRLVSGLPWKRGQQLLLVLNDTIIRQAGDSIYGQVYARTSAGIPVENIRVNYSLTDFGIVSAKTTLTNAITLTAREQYRSNRNLIKVEWVTRSGTFKDSIFFRTVSQTPPADFAYISPFLDYPLDTVNIYNIPGSLEQRAGILQIDTSRYSFSHFVDRADSVRSPFRVWVHNSYQYAYSDSAYLQGAVVYSPMYCPLKGPFGGPGWDIRWAPENLFVEPNVVSPYKVALAAAAQYPTTLLNEMSRVSMLRYIKDERTKWPNGIFWYEECFGPIPN